MQHDLKLGQLVVHYTIFTGGVVLLVDTLKMFDKMPKYKIDDRFNITSNQDGLWLSPCFFMGELRCRGHIFCV